MNPLKWLYDLTVRNQVMFFTTVWVAIGTFAHYQGFIGAFIYLPMIYLAAKVDTIRREVEGERDSGKG